MRQERRILKVFHSLARVFQWENTDPLAFIKHRKTTSNKGSQGKCIGGIPITIKKLRIRDRVG